MNKLPFISIVVCTFNGGNRISDCLDSLVHQDYQKNNYEILVVNDGSTDNTPHVLARYPGIRIVNHPKNLGISAARNSGLQSASGDIVAYTDDDCVADAGWLTSLLKHHNDDVVAVGGVTISRSLNTVMEKYMSETGYGNPTPIDFAKSKNPLYRFFVYLKDMFSPLIVSDTDPIPVRSIYTANASFKKEILIHAGGWASELNSSEDSEMCDRLTRLYPSKKILFTKNAVIAHKHGTSFWLVLKQTYLRGESTRRYYIKDNKIPPVFPFPVLVLFVSVLAFFITPLVGIISLILLPQILYSWWLIKCSKRHKGFYLLFPYMQMGLELATILGMVRGLLVQKQGNTTSRPNDNT